METERLVIRRFQGSDYEDFAELIRDKMASEYAKYDDAFPTDDESLKGILGYFAGTDEFYAIELKENRKVIGFTALNKVDDSTRNLGYCIHSTFQNKGYASEAAAEAKRFAREELKLKKLVSGTAAVNVPSVKLLKRTGFVEVSEGTGDFAGETFKTYSYECIL